MRIFVGNLSFRTEEPQLEQLFSGLGQVSSVRLVRDHETGRSRGFGFVEMNDDDQGRAACAALNQQEFEGQLKKQKDFETFFKEAPQLNPSRTLIKGVICGVRVEDIEEPLMREIRYLDKLVDELAKGKAMDKILRA